MKSLVLLGRLLFVLIFLQAAYFHMTGKGIDYATSAGVPLAHIMVPFSGIMSLAGSLSILLGYKARWGAFLIVLFLLPVTVMMHNFWAVSDPMMKAMQMANFLKNLSMMGGALVIIYFGSGPYSLDKTKD